MNSQNHPSAFSTLSGDATSKALELEIKSFCSHHGLTPRESEIVALMVAGIVRIKDVAAKLSLSPNTVNNHVNSIFMKTHSRSKSELLASFLSFVSEQLQSARMFRQSPRVVMLDRDTALTTALREVLEARGFRVQLSTTTAEVFDALAKLGPHFIIADLQTIGSDAIDFIHKVRAQAPVQLLLTGSGAGIFNRWHAMNEGAIELLSKPIDVVALLKTLMLNYIEDDLDRVRFLGSPAGAMIGPAELAVSRENLGKGGVFLSSEDLAQAFGAPVSEGDWLELRLRLDRGAGPIFAKGQVAWTRAAGEGAGKGGVGIRFVHLSRKDRDAFHKYVSENAIHSFIPAGSIV